jgi:hypothetical protein
MMIYGLISLMIHRLSLNSTDSSTCYDIVYNSDKCDKHDFPTTHGIKIFKEGQLYKSAILLGVGGATGISSDAALIDNNNLAIRCSNHLYSLTLPELELNWRIQPDWATCFSVHKFQDSYIVYGETSISRISRDGNILWNFSGWDIFVSLFESAAFEMHDEYIALTDFNGTKYKFDYSGKPNQL